MASGEVTITAAVLQSSGPPKVYDFTVVDSTGVTAGDHFIAPVVAASGEAAPYLVDSVPDGTTIRASDQLHEDYSASSTEYGAPNSGGGTGWYATPTTINDDELTRDMPAGHRGWRLAIERNTEVLKRQIGVLEAGSDDQGSGTSVTETIPANTLDTNFKRIEYEAWGLGPASGGPSTVTVSLEGTTIKAFSINAADQFVIRGTIMRVSAGNQRCAVTFIDDGGNCDAEVIALTEDETATLDLDVTIATGASIAVYTLLWHTVKAT